MKDKSRIMFEVTDSPRKSCSDEKDASDEDCVNVESKRYCQNQAPEEGPSKKLPHGSGLGGKGRSETTGWSGASDVASVDWEKSLVRQENWS